MTELSWEHGNDLRESPTQAFVGEIYFFRLQIIKQATELIGILMIIEATNNNINNSNKNKNKKDKNEEQW